MLKSETAVLAEQHFILSRLSPGPAQKGVALAIVVGLPVVFVLIAFGPFAHVHPKRVSAFVPAYVTAMFVCDSITAILLYARHRSNNMLFTFGITENLQNINNTPDIGFQLGFAYLPKRAGP